VEWGLLPVDNSPTNSEKLGDWDIGHCLSESDSYRLSMCFFVFDWILTDIVLPSGGEKIAGFCGLLRGLGVADLGRRCVLCVDRECVRVGGEKTENAKPGDRSPSPRYYYGGRGIFERFKSTFPHKVLISILNIIALIDRDLGNRATGKCDSVTVCDGVCDTVVPPPLNNNNNNNNKLYYIYRVRCHTVPPY